MTNTNTTDFCCFLDRPAYGGRNAADDLYASEYLCELFWASTRGTVGVPYPAEDITEVEAVTLFALGFGLAQAAAGLELLRAAGVTDETVFGDLNIEFWRDKVRQWYDAEAPSESRSLLYGGGWFQANL